MKFFNTMIIFFLLAITLGMASVTAATAATAVVTADEEERASAAGVVDGVGASQPVGGVPGGLRVTKAAAVVVVTTDNNNNNNNNDDRRKLQNNARFTRCRRECANYSYINHCLADNAWCLPYVTWYKKAYGV
jgi:hypothetical protein